MPRFLIYERQPTASGFAPVLYAELPVIKAGRVIKADGIGPRVCGDPVTIEDDRLTLDQAAALHPCPLPDASITLATEILSGPDQAEPDRTAMAIIDPPAAWADVLAERQRQIAVEGWDAAHDDEHAHGELAGAAATYAAYRSHVPAETIMGGDMVQILWPFSPDWFKPGTRRRDLVKAAALLLAEIERLDRVGGAH